MPDPDPLFSAATIGELTIANRIVMPSMTTRCADAEGFVTDRSIAYFVARARGGAGLVTVEMASPEKAGRHRRHELGIYDDRFLPGLTRLVAALHDAGARTAIQLGHGGGHTRIDICGEEPVAPSAIPHSVFEGTLQTVVPQAMSLGRIEAAIQAFVDAAARTRAAKFDCVEVHAAHGYLISQFLCPAENLRDDAYGGTLENRARFGLEIVRRIKARLGGFPVIFRLSVNDFFAEGLPLADGLQVAEWAAAAGADAIHVTAGHYRSAPPTIMIPPMAMPDAPFLDFARQVKARVSVPVIAVARLGDPARARAAIADGHADFVALGRPLLADPDWPRKVRAGEPVRRCLACNSCVDGMRGGDRLACIVNPTTGRERDFANSKPPRGERIAVIGAGPAGLAYAALVGLGNTVTVFERAQTAGGAFRQAAKAPLFQDVEAGARSFDVHIAALEVACHAAGVTFRFSTDPSRAPELLAPFDRVVIATGARTRLGLGPVVRGLLDLGVARWPLIRRMFANPALRNWFYYRARHQTGTAMARMAQPGQIVTIIGDARSAGKTKAAVTSAFEAALLP